MTLPLFDLGIQGSAKFSDCGTFRYNLERSNLGGSRTALVCMVNPSKAGAVLSDMTVTKLIGFSEPLDLARFIVVNAAALISTDPAELEPQATITSSASAKASSMCLSLSGPIGSAAVLSIELLAKRFPDRRQRVLVLLRSRGHELMCWGTTAGGHPKHPSRIPYSTQLVRFAA